MGEALKKKVASEQRPKRERGLGGGEGCRQKQQQMGLETETGLVKEE